MHEVGPSSSIEWALLGEGFTQRSSCLFRNIHFELDGHCAKTVVPRLAFRVAEFAVDVKRLQCQRGCDVGFCPADPVNQDHAQLRRVIGQPKELATGSLRFPTVLVGLALADAWCQETKSVAAGPADRRAV